MYFYVIFSDLKALFPLVYFMQNREDGFQDYFGKVWLNSEIAHSVGNWASRPIKNSVVLNKLLCAYQRKQVSTWFVA